MHEDMPSIDTLMLAAFKLQMMGRDGASDPDVDARTEIASAIADGFDDPDFTIGEVALDVGFSKRRVRDVLAEDNTSFRGEILRARLVKARYLLIVSRHTIDEVAFLCGYRCSSTFAKRFREETGMSPRAWRKSYGGCSRAGGTTGCFRSAAERARAVRQGDDGPDLRRPRPSAGERDVRDHERRHSIRRARLRSKPDQDR